MEIIDSVATVADLSDATFINVSATRRRLVTALHVEGPLTIAELSRRANRHPRLLRGHLRRLEARGILARVGLEHRTRPRENAELYALTA
ncbi:helix-turn-helix domain-containing protein [Frondihabitans cladoniiphilus]|uniref:Uncharacterized protein n=1 Tax=Frondihabitans cladoniiphilus TaxID=715785 RepID=A0ABP8VRZ4_9MICO